MCFHKWGKWEQYEWNGVKYLYGTTITYPVTQRRQKRVCLKCGKMQDKEIYD
jgi:hypothetical protein